MKCCRGYKKFWYCGLEGVPQPLSNFTNKGKYGQCYICKRVAGGCTDFKYNPRRNAISKIAYKIAGSSVLFYKMPKEWRLHKRAIATQLYEAGKDVASAIEARKTRKNGFVYFISHPKLQGIKVGSAFDVHSRLSTYQTYCPERSFVLEHYHYFDDCREAESDIQNLMGPWHLSGEWYDVDTQLTNFFLGKVCEGVAVQ